MPEVEKLKLKIIGRLRNSLMAAMETLKKPRTNTQIIQQNVLLGKKELTRFLRSHAEVIFIEVSNYYGELMCSLYLNIFKSYISELGKLYAERVSKYESIIVDESEYINAAINKKQSAFEVGTREKILQELNKEPIICHISYEQKLTHSLEEIFRSQNKLLVDATVNEYFFVLDFFGLKPSQGEYTFKLIFAKPVQYFLETLQNTISYTYDCLGLLLMVLINDQFKSYLAQKSVPILDFYFDKYCLSKSAYNSVDFVLWPRILQILDGHIATIKQAASKGIKSPATTVTAITKRYVELASGIYKVTKQKTQSMLVMRMAQMRVVMVDLLRQIGERMPDEKHKMIFMLNNLEYVCDEFRALQIEKFDDLTAFLKEYDQWEPRFIRVLLLQEFKSLFDLVAKYTVTTEGKEGTELQMVAADEIKNVNKAYLESVGNDFALSWGKKVEGVQQTINVSISSKEGARQLLANLLEELMAQYATFGEIARIGHPEYFKELTAQHVLFDLKNLSNSLNH